MKMKQQLCIQVMDQNMKKEQEEGEIDLAANLSKYTVIKKDNGQFEMVNKKKKQTISREERKLKNKLNKKKKIK